MKPRPLRDRIATLIVAVGYAAMWLLCRAAAWSLIGGLIGFIPAIACAALWSLVSPTAPGLAAQEPIISFVAALVCSAGFVLGGLWGIKTGIRKLVAETRQAIFFVEVSDMVQEGSKGPQ